MGRDVVLGHGGFADDTAPRDALVAVPRPPGSDAQSVEAAGLQWVIGESLLEARERAGKVQGRRTTVDPAPPLSLPELPEGGVRLATSWVEPGYLEPDASWCLPGGEPANPLANGGAFGGKATSPVAAAARELAERHGRPVRDAVLARGRRPARPEATPVRGECGAARRDALRRRHVRGRDSRRGPDASELPRSLELARTSSDTELVGPPTSRAARAAVFAEMRVLQEGALDAAGFDRAANLPSARATAVFLDNVVSIPNIESLAGARVVINPESGALERVEVRVAAGDPLDEVVLRSYAIGAAHMALGWVLTEGLAVDPETGEVHDLTIRSFGIIRAKDTPAIEVTIVDDPGPPLARSSDAVFVAVAAATWNALTRADGARPETFPAHHTRTARMLRT